MKSDSPRPAEAALSEHDSFLPAVLDAIGTPVGVADRAGRIVHFNRAFKRMAGYRVEEISNRPFWEVFLGAEEAEEAKAFFANPPLGGPPVEIETHWITRSGEQRTIIWTASAIQRGGEIAYVVGSGLDITERRSTEEALRQSEERFALAAAGSEQGLYDIDRRTNDVYFSPQAQSLLGFVGGLTIDDEFDSWFARIHPDDRPRVVASLVAHLQGRSNRYQSEYRMRGSDGAHRWILARGHCIRDDSGWPVRFVGWLADITESKQTEALLQRSALLLQNMGEGACATDEQGVIVFTNDAFDAMFGYERGELIGQSAAILNDAPPEESERIVAEIVEHLRNTGFYAGEFANRKKDGTPFTTRARIKALELPDATWWVTLQEDITARRKTEIALRESEEKFRDLVENINEVIYVLDDRFRLTYVSPALEWLTGYRPPDAMGWSFDQFVHPEDLPAVLEAYRCNKEEQRPARLDIRYFNRAGAIGWCRLSTRGIFRDGHFAGIRGVADDITELKRAEDNARRRQAELSHVLRVSTMGEMASGLAHELNQPLAAIVNYARGCARRLHPGAPASPGVLKKLEQIAEEALRAGRVITALRQLVRKDAPERTLADLNGLVHEVVQLIGPQARAADVSVTVDVAPQMPKVLVEQIQIEQVILNLLRNGIEAIGRLNSRKRELLVRTWIAEQESLGVSVSDTGDGVGPGIRENLFEPFFTTKANGLGMGLSISRSIIESHGGRLWAMPNSGPGATFCFTLPAAGDSSVGQHPDPVASPVLRAHALAGGGRRGQRGVNRRGGLRK